MRKLNSQGLSVWLEIASFCLFLNVKIKGKWVTDVAKYSTSCSIVWGCEYQIEKAAPFQCSHDEYLIGKDYAGERKTWITGRLQSCKPVDTVSFAVHLMWVLYHCNAPSNVIKHLQMHTHARHHKTVFSQTLTHTHRRLHNKEEKLSSTLLADENNQLGQDLQKLLPKLPWVALEWPLIPRCCPLKPA